MFTKPTLALLVGASFWGVVWYPFRVLDQAGIDGIWSTLLTYGFALVVACVAFPRHALAAARLTPLSLLMGLAIGWSNLAYVLGVLEGEVMRVLLLFYLAPLWTPPFARLLLGERLDGAGVAVMGLAFAGALVMLWRPEIGLPWPTGRAEWLGLAAGILFALGNVLVRRLEGMTDMAKSIVIWAGVVIAALVHLRTSSLATGHATRLALDHGPLIASIGIALLAMGLALQYGLSRLPANRAIVILLSELVVAAVAAHYLAGEVLRPQDWVGGTLIASATLASGWMEARRGRRAVAASTPSSGAPPPPS
jgi:drug/metabolite transporter (DMT)-like permease